MIHIISHILRELIPLPLASLSEFQGLRTAVLLYPLAANFACCTQRLYLPTRIDATPRKNIISGIDTSHNQIRAPRGSRWLGRFSSRWNRGSLLFSQPSISMTQPPDGHSRRGDEIVVVVAIVFIRSLLSERETILKMIVTTRNSTRHSRSKEVDRLGTDWRFGQRDRPMTLFPSRL